MRRWIPVLALAFILAAMQIPQPQAASREAPTLEVRAGFDGYFKYNSWLPVQVLVINGENEYEGQIQLAISDTQLGQILYTQPIRLASHARQLFTLYAFIENYAGRLAVHLVEKGKVVAVGKLSLEPLPAEDLLVGVLSDDPSALHHLAGLPPIGKGRVRVAHMALPEVPSQGRALGSLDVLIVHRVDTSRMSAAQRNALRGWVGSGGRLIVCGGPDAASAAAGLDGLLPVEVVGTRTTTDLSALGEFASVPFAAYGPTVVAQLERSAGYVVAGTTALPLLIHHRLDQGHVGYLALDPDQEPVRSWAGNESLWGKLLTLSAPGRTTSMQPGWSNILNAVADLPALDLPSAMWVLAFALLYVITVGPLNLFVLKLVGKRALAWITVPLTALAFSGLAYGAGLAIRGPQVIVNQITIVHARPESGTASMDSYIGLYSPVRRTYDIRLPEDALVYKLTRLYYYPPGEGRRTLIVEQGPPTRLRQLEVDVGAMRSFAAYAVEPWDAFDAALTLTRTPQDAVHVTGTIANRGTIDLRDPALVWNNEPVPIANLKAGTAIEVAAKFQSALSPPPYPLVDALAKDSPTGSQEQHERECRWEVLRSLFSPEHHSWLVPVPDQVSSLVPAPDPVSLTDLWLVGWLDESPMQIAVERTRTTVNATTLLLVPLSPDETQRTARTRRVQ